MSSHCATIDWENSGPDFSDNKYSRAHRWLFDGGAVVAASASPAIVPLPWSDAANVDPEEAFVASLASCHMLFFLSIAAEHGYTVTRYRDEASGAMGRIEGGNVAITRVTLHPRVKFTGERVPDDARIQHLHHLAHEKCFIANSVITAITIDAAPWSAEEETG